MRLYETIDLPNGLTLEIWDYSRRIASDITKVELVAQMEVAFRPEYFPFREQYDKLVKTIGPTSRYVYRKWRTFVNNDDRDAIFHELLQSFKTHAKPYLENEGFPARFAKAKLREIEEHWYRYRPRTEE